MVEDWIIISGPVGGPPSGDHNFIIRKGEELLVDSFEDEIFSLVRGRDGWVIVSGCCHRRLRNTLRSAKFLADDEPITAIVGGLHLEDASKEDLEDAANQLRQMPGIQVYPCHCTGEKAVKHLSEQLPGQVKPATSGTQIIA